ncbi:MAG: hypothetical protein K8R88_01305 [Armatimonadetes bacterium]|nr:hypothetical protein [Armatimonadota bacterium]
MANLWSARILFALSPCGDLIAALKRGRGLSVDCNSTGDKIALTQKRQ